MAELAIPVKGGGTVTIDPEKVPTEVYEYIFWLGCKALLGRGMTKITAAGGSDEAMKAAYQAQAEQNVQNAYEGKVRFVGMGKKKSAGTDRKIHVLALNTARKIVKEAARSQGIKVSYVKASEWTKHATQYLDEHPELLETARAEFVAQVKAADELSLKPEDVKLDPALVAAGEAKKKAGKTARAKPTA